jgi:hypothetical protein
LVLLRRTCRRYAIRQLPDLDIDKLCLWLSGRLNTDSTSVLVDNNIPAESRDESVSDGSNAFKDAISDTALQVLLVQRNISTPQYSYYYQSSTDQIGWDADDTSNGVTEKVTQSKTELWVGNWGSASESDEGGGEESDLHCAYELKFWI